jgi:hypothetical protein
VHYNTRWQFFFNGSFPLTTLAQQLPVDHVEKLQSFRTFVQKQIAEHKIRSDNIINMDEVPLTFDIP